MNTYDTTSGRVFLTTLDLSYAMNSAGEIDCEKVKARDKKHIDDVPNRLTADILLYVSKALPTKAVHEANVQKLPASLFHAATTAAEAHAQCLAHPNKSLDALTYPHMAPTNHGRYAISAVQLYDYAEPYRIKEEDLPIDTQKHTCYIADLRLALFLSKASAGRFCAAETKLDTTHHPEYYSHNRIIRQNGRIMVRDGSDIVPLQDILRTASVREQAIHLSAAEYQTAICSTYLTITQAAG